MKKALGRRDDEVPKQKCKPWIAIAYRLASYIVIACSAADKLAIARVKLTI